MNKILSRDLIDDTIYEILNINTPIQGYSNCELSDGTNIIYAKIKQELLQSIPSNSNIKVLDYSVENSEIIINQVDQIDSFAVFECNQCKNSITNTSFLLKSSLFSHAYNISLEEYIIKCVCGQELGIMTDNVYRLNMNCLERVKIRLESLIVI